MKKWKFEVEFTRELADDLEVVRVFHADDLCNNYVALINQFFLELDQYRPMNYVAVASCLNPDADIEKFTVWFVEGGETLQQARERLRKKLQHNYTADGMAGLFEIVKSTRVAAGKSTK